MKLPSEQLDFLNEADNRWVNLPQTNQEALLEIIALLLMQIILPNQPKQLEKKSGDPHER